MYNNLLILLILILILVFIYYNSINNNILVNNYEFNLLNFNNLKEYIYLLNDKNNNKLLNYSSVIPNYLNKRNQIPITNKYNIIKEDKDYSDFHFIIYWINNNEGLLIIRRLDDYKIIKPIKLKIFDIDNKNFEIINIDSTQNNSIILNIKCNIILVKKNTDTNQIIPKIIIQTDKSNECDLAKYNSIMSFIELNPEYEYMFFNDEECYNFIKNNYDEITLNTYNKLKPTAYKADLFRACVLYKLGGCYFDIKQVNRVPLRDIINENQDLILCKDAHPSAHYNAFILCSPNNLIIKKIIDSIIENVKNDYYGTCPLCPTGPCLLYKICPKHETDIVHKFNHIIYAHHKIRHKGYIYNKQSKKIIINTAYKGYYKKDNKSYYANLWFNKDIYNIFF
jgi:mannosyltransferase OCH1-like enzyme